MVKLSFLRNRPVTLSREIPRLKNSPLKNVQNIPRFKAENWEKFPHKQKKVVSNQCLSVGIKSIHMYARVLKRKNIYSQTWLSYSLSPNSAPLFGEIPDAPAVQKDGTAKKARRKNTEVNLREKGNNWNVLNSIKQRSIYSYVPYPWERPMSFLFSAAAMFWSLLPNFASSITISWIPSDEIL